MLAFIHIHKTGGSTLEYILRSTYGSRFAMALPWQRSWAWPVIFGADDLRLLMRIYPNLLCIGGHRVRAYADLEAVMPDVRYFTWLRDPLQQRVAMYQHGRRSEITLAMMLRHPIKYGWNRHEHGVPKGRQEKRSFDVWCQGEGTRNHMTKMIAGVPDAPKAIALIEQKRIFVGLTEAFDESLALLQQLVAPELDIAYSRRNVSPDRAASQQILSDPALRQLAMEGDEADRELYAYAQDVLLPSYRRAAAQQPAPPTGPIVQRSGFNRKNLFLFELKHKAIYRPTLELYRKVRGEKRAKS